MHDVRRVEVRDVRWSASAEEQVGEGRDECSGEEEVERESDCSEEFADGLGEGTEEGLERDTEDDSSDHEGGNREGRQFRGETARYVWGHGEVEEDSENVVEHDELIAG